MPASGPIHRKHQPLETLADPDHIDHIDMRTWVGKEWKPERFNKDGANFDDPYKRWKYAFLEK